MTRPRGLRALRRGVLGDQGAVAAEFALSMTAVAVVLLLAVGGLGAAARQILLQDAAADAARLASRGEPAARVHAAVTAAVPGATASVARAGDLVCVSATAPGILGIAMRASSCALDGGL